MHPITQAVLAGQPLPAPSPKLIKAWRDAFVEAERSEYAFKKGCVRACAYDPVVLGRRRAHMCYMEMCTRHTVQASMCMCWMDEIHIQSI